VDGLVTLLPTHYYQTVESIWDRLEKRCGLKGIRVTPYPHFSWQIAQAYDAARLEAAIRRLAAKRVPFNVSAAGLGIFPGEHPVIYLLLARSRAMTELHEMIWRASDGLHTGVSDFYNDRNWAPHISLAYEDLSRKNLPCALDELAFEEYRWEFAVDNIAFIREPEGGVGELKWKIPLGE